MIYPIIPPMKYPCDIFISERIFSPRYFDGRCRGKSMAASRESLGNPVAADCGQRPIQQSQLCHYK